MSLKGYAPAFPPEAGHNRRTNHDFLERAYGNYWGLCNLLAFLAREVGGEPGPLTCMSSHAYVSGRKTALKALVEGFA